MEHAYWLERWQNNQIGFHRQQINQFLIQHYPADRLPANPRILVPLCGKSQDLLWLATKASFVCGIELSPLACQQFFGENQLIAEESKHEAYTVYQHANLGLYCGDFFACEPTTLGTLNFCYDRAALVALPANLRKQYAEQLCRLLPAGSLYLLITMEYQAAGEIGPPFAVSQEEVTNLFAANFTINQLASQQEVVTGSLAVAGVKELINRVYLLQRRNN